MLLLPKTIQVTARQGLNRTKGIKAVGKTISSDQMDVHIVHTLTQKRQEGKRQILHDIQAKELVTDISEGQASAMKADLGITWYCLNKLKRFVLIDSLLGKNKIPYTP